MTHPSNAIMHFMSTCIVPTYIRIQLKARASQFQLKYKKENTKTGSDHPQYMEIRKQHVM